MDGKSKTSHIAPTTLGQMVPIESARIKDLSDVKVYGAFINGAHDDFDTAQDAIDFAPTVAADIVVFPSETFGSIDIPAGLIVTGTGIRHNGSTQFEATVSGGATVDVSENSTLSNCVVKNNGSGSGDHAVTGSTRCTVKGCHFHTAGGDGFNSNDGNDILVTHNLASPANISGASILLTTNSNDCIVDTNRNMGTITDNGTGNVVGDNT